MWIYREKIKMVVKHKKEINLSHTKRFDGEYYDREYTEKTKTKAKQWAAFFRGNRHKARVVKTSVGYVVYVKRREGWDNE
jgi:hypothetical protein